MKLSCMSTMLLALLPIAASAQTSFTFCYDPYPPYTLGKTGTPTGGLKVQLIDAVFNEIDEARADVILLPWKQCQNQAKLGNVDGILPLFKNDERSQYMVFSESVFDQTSVFWYKKSKYPDGINWQHFSDLSHLKLGMLIGGFIDKDMEAVFEENRGIHRGKNVENLFQILSKDRVDLIAIDRGVGQYTLIQKGWQNDYAMVEKPIGVQESYFGLSKKSAAAALLDKINTVIAKLHADGTIQRIQESTAY